MKRRVLLVALLLCIAAGSMPALAATPTTPAVRQEAMFLVSKQGVLRVVEILNFQGTNPAGWRVSLPVGYQSLGVHQVTGRISHGTDFVELPGNTQKAFITFQLPMSSYQTGWTQRIYDPTEVLYLFTGPGLSLPVVLNEQFYQSKPPTEKVGGVTFQAYYTYPLTAGTVFRINLQRPGVLPGATGTPQVGVVARLILVVAFLLALGGLVGAFILYRRGLPDPGLPLRREAAAILQRGDLSAEDAERLRGILHRLEEVQP